MTMEMDEARRRELQDILQKNVELLLVLNKTPKDGEQGSGGEGSGEGSTEGERTKVNTNVHMPASSKGMYVCMSLFKDGNSKILIKIKKKHVQ